MRALDFLQGQGIVHTDLKSENIMITFDKEESKIESVKVIDFGTSIQFKDVNSRLTVTTPEYLPPEVLNFVDLKT